MRASIHLSLWAFSLACAETNAHAGSKYLYVWAWDFDERDSDFLSVLGLGKLFPLYFGLLSIAIGAASLVNARLVLKYGMRPLSQLALIVIASLSIGFVLFAYASAGQPPLWTLVAYLLDRVLLQRASIREHERSSDGARGTYRRRGRSGRRGALYVHFYPLWHGDRTSL